MPVQVNNVAPTASLVNLGGNVNQGNPGLVGFLSPFDPSNADTNAHFHYAWDFNNDGVFDLGNGTYGGSGTSSSATVPGSFLADTGSDTIHGRIIDQNNGFTDYTTTINVQYVGPIINLPATATAGVNSPFSLGGSVSAPGGDANFAAATVNFGDGTGNLPLTINPDGTFTLSHTYTAPSAPSTPYQILVTVPDFNGAAGTATVAVTAVANTLEVATFNPTTSGFDITFNKPVDPSSLKLYGSGTTVIPDVTLIGQVTGAITGSLIWDPSTDTLHFVQTEKRHLCEWSGDERPDGWLRPHQRLSAA